MEPPTVSRRTYQLIAVATLPLPFLGTYLLGPGAAALVPASTGPVPTLLGVLAYLLVLLACVLIWGAMLLPLRRRAGITPLRDELQQIREAGGLGEAIAKEQRALEARAAAGDPSYHATFALVGLLLTLASAGLSWALWSDGYVMLLALVAALVCPALALYHAVQWLRLRSRGL